MSEGILGHVVSSPGDSVEKDILYPTICEQLNNKLSTTTRHFTWTLKKMAFIDLMNHYSSEEKSPVQRIQSETSRLTQRHVIQVDRPLLSTADEALMRVETYLCATTESVNEQKKL